MQSSIVQVAAPVTAATLGFGVGHVLNGSYLERGWKFTLLDSGTAFLMVAALACDFDCPSMPLSVALFLGVRIWQVLDCVLLDDPSSSLAIIPVGTNSFVLSYNYKF